MTDTGRDALVAAIKRMDECRAGCDAGDPFYADAQAWDVIRATLTAIPDALVAERKALVARIKALPDNARNDCIPPHGFQHIVNEIASEIGVALAAIPDAEQQAPPTPHLDPAHSDKDPPHPTHNFRPSK